MRFTEYHCGVAVIKSKNKLKEAMKKLAEFEDKEDTVCKGCYHEDFMDYLLPCRLCARNKEDKYTKKSEVNHGL